MGIPAFCHPIRYHTKKKVFTTNNHRHCEHHLWFECETLLLYCRVLQYRYSTIQYKAYSMILTSRSRESEWFIKWDTYIRKIRMTAKHSWWVFSDGVAFLWYLRIYGGHCSDGCSLEMAFLLIFTDIFLLSYVLPGLTRAPFYSILQHDIHLYRNKCEYCSHSNATTSAVTN